MTIKRNILFLLNGFFLILLLYFSGYSKIIEVHIAEFFFLLSGLALYLFYKKRNSFFLTYLLAFIIAQFIFVIYVVYELPYIVSASGGVLFLFAYVSMIVYIFKAFEWHKLNLFSFITGIMILVLIMWILYTINHMMISERAFSDPENSNYLHKIMIYVYFTFLLVVTFLGFLNLSIKTDSWSVLFCLTITCALSSELSQIFQAIYYGKDAIGIINIIDKAFSVASIYFFYLSTEKRKPIEYS